MGDRTCATVTIYSLPGKYEEVAKILDDKGYQRRWDGPVGPTVELGVTYGAFEMSLDEPETLVAEITNLFDSNDVAYNLVDGLTIEAYNDPYAEWLGQYVLSTPFGVYEADCDAQGTPMFNAGQIRQAVIDGTLDTLLGTQYFNYIAGYVSAAQALLEAEAAKAQEWLKHKPKGA